jgi:DnaJ-class molecular chaperone
LRPDSELVIVGEGMTRTIKRGSGRGDLRVKFEIVHLEQFDEEVKQVIALILPDVP